MPTSTPKEHILKQERNKAVSGGGGGRGADAFFRSRGRLTIGPRRLIKLPSHVTVYNHPASNMLHGPGTASTNLLRSNGCTIPSRFTSANAVRTNLRSDR